MDRFAANDRKVKVMKTLHIPNDIFFSILSKLPIKSFKRFECVCKSWSLLSDDSYFMTMYRNYFLTKYHSYYDDTSILLHQTFSFFEGFYWDQTFELYSFSGERFDNRVKLEWPDVKINRIYNHKEYDNGFDIIGSGSVNGTLCLLCSLLVNIILWNPSTKEFKVIPPNPIHSHLEIYVDHREFGYDRVKDDYKVMRYIASYEQANETYRCSIWEVYSLRSNSWRKLDVDMHNDQRMCHEQQVYIDGLSHWRCETHNEGYLLSFDWSNEVFKTTPIPSYMNDDILNYISVRSDLVLLNGSIALILNYRKTSTFHISILGELGVKESWTKLFILGPLPFLDYPIGAGKKGDMLFKNKDGRLVWLDLNTQMIVDSGISSQDQFVRSKIVVHKENLLPFEGKNM